MQLTTLDYHHSRGFTVATIADTDLPAFVSAVAGVCEIMALAPTGEDALGVGNGTFWANCYTVEADGAWQWQAELYRKNQTTYRLLLDSRADAEALRRRLAEVVA